jgi:hypothetical protein
MSSEMSTRRKFLQKSLKTAGYAIPTILVFSMGSLNAWADRYNNPGHGGTPPGLGDLPPGHGGSNPGQGK